MIIVSIIQLILFLLLIPFALGISVTRFFDSKYNTIGNILVCGFTCELALFQILFVSFYFLGFQFLPLVIVYSVIVTILAIASFIWSRKYYKKLTFPIIDMGFITFIVITVFMLTMRNLQGVNDGDDAFVLGNALVTLNSGLFYKIDYYTGFTINSYTRHLLASSPIFIAYLAKVSFIHPTILAHRVLGCFYIILHNMIIYNIACILFSERKKSQYRGLFAAMVAFIAMWDFHSMMTDSTFMLTRTWQGKAMFAEIAVPLAFLLYLIIGNEKKLKISYIVFIAILCISTVAMTPGAIYMFSLLIGLLSIIMLIVKKKPYYVTLFLSLIPMICFGIIYVLKCR